MEEVKLKPILKKVEEYSDSSSIDSKTSFNEIDVEKYPLHSTNFKDMIEESITNALSENEVRNQNGLNQLMKLTKSPKFQPDDYQLRIIMIIIKHLKISLNTQSILKTLCLIKIIACKKSVVEELIATGIIAKLVTLLSMDRYALRPIILHILTRVVYNSINAKELINMDVVDKLRCIILEDNNNDFNILTKSAKLINQIAKFSEIDNFTQVNKQYIFEITTFLLAVNNFPISKYALSTTEFLCSSRNNDTVDLLNKYCILDFLIDNITNSSELIRFHIVNCLNNISKNHVLKLIEIDIWSKLRNILLSDTDQIKSRVIDILAYFVKTGKKSCMKTFNELDFFNITSNEMKNTNEEVQKSLLFFLKSCFNNFPDEFSKNYSKLIIEFICQLLNRKEHTILINVLTMFNLILRQNQDRKEILIKEINKYCGISYLEQLQYHKVKSISSISKQILSCITN